MIYSYVLIAMILPLKGKHGCISPIIASGYSENVQAMNSLTTWMFRWKWMDQRLGSVGYDPNIHLLTSWDVHVGKLS